MKAEDLLKPGETALAFFTRGPKLEIHADGTGHTGTWVINPNKNTDRVIIYWRRELDSGEENEIYLADRADTIYDPATERYFVHFQAARLVGTTQKKWPEFTEGGQNPVKYVSRR
jgi:hypothetical protein